LRAQHFCQFPFSSKKTDVCINPYHYERVESHQLPMPLGPGIVRGGPTAPTAGRFQSPGEPSNDQQQSMMNLHHHPQQPPPRQQPHYNPNNQPMNYGDYYGMNTLTSPEMVSSVASPSNLNSPGGASPTNLGSPYGPETPPPAYSPMEEPKYAVQLQIPDQSIAQQQQHALINENAMDTSQTNNNILRNAATEVAYVEPTYWCSIAYYELNSRVGEVYHAKDHSINVDGFTNPSMKNNNRFCLGQLSNVNRNSTIENTRRHIGKGIRLQYAMEGDHAGVYVYNQSDKAVFVNSKNTNEGHGYEPGTVIKVPPQVTLRIFDLESFAQKITKSASESYESVFELTKMCTIRLSFVKGWGREYHRLDVTSTPCWIEIHLDGPLQWLDRILTQLGSSSKPISSVS